MQTDIRSELEKTSIRVDAIFAITQVILPMWHLYCRNGDELVLANDIQDKRMAVDAMREVCQRHDVVRYVFVTESYAVNAQNTADEEQARRWIAKHGSLEGHPGCEEVVHFVADDVSQGLVVASRAILRAGDRAYLGPLIFSDHEQAGDDRLMQNVLPRRKETLH